MLSDDCHSGSFWFFSDILFMYFLNVFVMIEACQSCVLAGWRLWEGSIVTRCSDHLSLLFPPCTHGIILHGQIRKKIDI